MAAKTLEQFYKEYRSGFNPITGEPNLFKDLTDEHVWDAAIKSVEQNGSSHNSESKPCCKATFALVLEYTLSKVTKCPVCGTPV